ncbi:MAG: Calx-beta domain-containing protein [Thermoanaerobaculia bacterium]
MYVSRIGFVTEVVAAAVLTITAASLQAQSVTLVRDIDPSTTSTTLLLNSTGDMRAYYSPVANVAYFGGVRHQTGFELWKTDGTVAGTSIVRDINEGIAGTGWSGALLSWDPENGPVTAFNGEGYFFVTTPDLETALWKTDGSAAGTVLVRTFASQYMPIASPPVVSGPTLYFMGIDEIFGAELWKTDGTRDGTTLVRDILPGRAGAFPSHLTDLNGTLFFTVTGKQLWKSDGTEGGTVLVHDFGTSATLSGLTKVGSRLFLFDAEPSGTRLWVTDGSPAGTVIVLDLGSSSSYCCRAPQALGTRLVFASNSGPALWISDGTGAGTAPLSTSPDGPFNFDYAYAVVGGRLYFTAKDSSSQDGLWLSDGTELGTHRILTGIHPLEFAAVGSDVYFSTVAGELWHTDGTTIGTKKVADVSASSLSSLPGVLLFENGGLPWRSDGTAAGTYPLASGLEAASSDVTSPTAIGNRIVFAAYDRDAGFEPWVTDGTTAGTTRLADISSGPFSSTPDHFVAFGTHAYFAAYPSPSSARFVTYRTDGTAAGTEAVRDGAGQELNLQPLQSFLPGLLLRNESGGDLWIMRTDGAVPENVHPFSFTDEHFFPFPGSPGIMVFRAATDTTPREPWITDGTTAGTRSLAELTGTASVSAQPVAVSDAFLFFCDSYRLWRTDGTHDGTILLHTFDPADLSATFWRMLSEFGTLGHLVLFGAPDADHGQELWVTDGTVGGTHVLKDIRAGSYSSKPRSFTPLRGGTLFVARTDENGNELWRTDGSAAGTFLLADIAPGVESSDPSDFFRVGRHVYFSAADGVGRELWVTDGTPDGTHLAADVVPGLGSSSPGSLARIGRELLFAASTEEIGRELWKYEIPVGRAQFPSTTISVGERSGSAVVTVQRQDGSIGSLFVSYATADGSAIAASDYMSTRGTLSWSDGDATARKITVPIIADAIQEGDESFTLALHLESSDPAAEAIPSSDGDETLTITILDVFTPGTIVFTAASTTIPGTAGPVRVEVRRDGGSDGIASIHYRTEVGTALPGRDFTPVEGDFVWSSGDATSRTIEIPIAPHSALDGDRSFEVRLTSASGSGLGSMDAQVVTILAAPAMIGRIPALSLLGMVALVALLLGTGLGVLSWRGLS